MSLVATPAGHSAVTAAPAVPGLVRRASETDAVAELMSSTRDLLDRAKHFEPTFAVVHLLKGTAPEPPTEHVELLLLDRDLNLWAGHGDAGKSTTLLTLAVCVALGLPVFGTLAVRRPGPVLLVLPEDGRGQARMALDAIIAGLGLDGAQRAVLEDRLLMIEENLSVNITADARTIASTAIEHQAVLVILDPIRNLLGDGDEMCNNLAGVTCHELRREICRRAGATVLLSHHNRKPGTDRGADSAPSIHEMRGAGGWANGSRLVFGVSKKADRITLTAIKSNRLRTGIKHELDLSIEADPANRARWLSCRITDGNRGASSDSLTPGRGRALNSNEAAALACLDDKHEQGLALSWSRWCAESGLKPDTFKSVRTRLLDARLAAAVPTGRVKRTGGTEYNYTLTPEGRSALANGWADSPKGETVSER